MSNRIAITVKAPMSEPVTTHHRTFTGAARRLVFLDREAADVQAAWGRGVYSVEVEVDGRHVPESVLALSEEDYAAGLIEWQRNAADAAGHRHGMEMLGAADLGRRYENRRD